ncbi:MAG: nucleotidyltransferase family protein [Chloroflexota bacterium]
MIAALLLAAGESTRMGQPKALLPWRGRTLLESQLAILLDAPVDPVVVVLGHRADDLRPLLPTSTRLRVVLNPRYAEGRSTSIAAGASTLPPATAGALVASVDQPLDSEVLALMLAAHGDGASAIVVPSLGQRRGHPVLFDASILPELLTVAEASQGLREVITRHAGAIHYVPVASPLVRLNFNTPAEYQSAFEHFGRAAAARHRGEQV